MESVAREEGPSALKGEQGPERGGDGQTVLEDGRSGWADGRLCALLISQLAHLAPSNDGVDTCFSIHRLKETRRRRRRRRSL